MVKNELIRNLQLYTTDGGKILSAWAEVEKSYSAPSRHYHNLTHLDNLLIELTPFKSRFDHWEAVVLAVVYHDIIYSVLKGNNEEKSAVVAEKRLSAMAVPNGIMSQCQQLILATKKHKASDTQTNLFTDADLSILGADAEAYKVYARQVRSEYSIYPDLIYYPGRRKVLEHFLAMDNIFKTGEFRDRYEMKARSNLRAELANT
jgi:predicted metal-dependent HD superfamily phosphohydrolase